MQHAGAGGGACCVHLFLPQLKNLQVERVVADDDCLRITARTRMAHASCPGCGTESSRVHARHERRVHDGVAGGRPVVICLAVRRFVCVDSACGTKTFTEQVPGLTLPYRRRSVALLDTLENVALALAGRAGARPAGLLGIVVHPTTLIRLIRALPEPELTQAPEVIGVDDFALRKSRRYGTVIVDMGTGKVIDVLDGRDAEPFKRWLTDHPGARVVCRDRAGAYALAVRESTPEAIECADRWHLWRNLAEHVERIVVRHRDCLKRAAAVSAGSATGPEAEATAVPPAMPAPITHPAGEPQPGPEPNSEPRLAQRIRERHAAIHTLKAEGLGLREIARRLELNRKTVRRFAQANSVEDLVAKTLARDTLLDAHMPYLTWRWTQGCRDAAVLHAELRARGYRGSVRTLYRYLQPLRSLASDTQTATGAGPDPAPPKVRHVTAWLLRRPDDLTPVELGKLAAVQAECPCLDRAASHVTAFAKMMAHLRGVQDLDGWLAAVEADDIPELRTFARGIRQDYAAVCNGLSLPHNSGACEGNVNRLKALKRQMFGRAGLDLLRKRAMLLT
ncbi:ISL3 family transposase [Nonomuraea sp. NPDC046802]|uniref:ISL3 family transposase n=1 Tax=Nonomuraea sp. NPDC046802 TaxID=3154919 RepID=UPI0033EE3F72